MKNEKREIKNIILWIERFQEGDFKSRELERQINFDQLQRTLIMLKEAKVIAFPDKNKDKI